MEKDTELARIKELRGRLYQIDLEVIAIIRGNRGYRFTSKLSKLFEEKINIHNLLAILEPSLIDQLKK